MEKARIAKAARTFIRLKHSLEADEEINDVLPDTLDEFDHALARGDLKALDVRAGLVQVIGGSDEIRD